MKKYIILTILLSLFYSPLWGQLNIVGENTEKPQTTNNYLDKPIIIEELLPRYYITTPWDHYEENLHCCVPEGQRFFCCDLEQSQYVYSMDGDTLTCGLPSGYYKYVGVLLYDEQIDTLYHRVRRQWKENNKIKCVDGSWLFNRGYEYAFGNMLTLSELRKRMVVYGNSGNLKEVLETATYWGIFEDDSGKQYYSSNRCGIKKNTLLTEYYEEISRVFKDKDIVIRDYQYSNERFINKIVYDYWTDTPVPINIINTYWLYSDPFHLTNEECKKIQYYHVNDIVVDLKRGDSDPIRIIAVINDSKGNTFSIRIPKFALRKFHSGSMVYYGYEDRQLIPKDTFLSYIRMTEQERKNQDALEKQKKAKAEQSHKTEVIQKYGERMGNLILQRKVALGMTPEMVKESIGYPSRSYKKTTVFGTTLVFEYAYLVLTFGNDKLVSVTEVK